MPSPGLLGKIRTGAGAVWETLMGGKTGKWALPAFGIAAGAPIVAHELGSAKREREKRYENMLRQVMTVQEPITFGVPSMREQMLSRMVKSDPRFARYLISRYTMPKQAMDLRLLITKSKKRRLNKKKGPSVQHLKETDRTTSSTKAAMVHTAKLYEFLRRNG